MRDGRELGNPACAAVGMSGAAGKRRPSMTVRIRIFPVRASSFTEAGGITAT
jgi:hypothetical protein